jgi:hypothetical protein
VVTVADFPAAAAATVMFSIAHPRPVTSSMSVRSVAGRARERSAITSMASSAKAKRHGWVLCGLAPRTAAATSARGLPSLGSVLKAS